MGAKTMLGRERRGWQQGVAAWAVVTLLLALQEACGGTASAPPPPPPPPPVITVSVMPSNATVFLGQTQSFTSVVTGTSNTSVNWSVNGIAGGTASIGTVSAAGLYTAPQTMLPPAGVTVTATSQADQSASGSASVTIRSDIIVSVSPTSASLSIGGSQAFTATVTSSGNPSQAVNWSVNGNPGGNPTLGEISITGSDSATYTAPAAPPSPPTVSVTATSVADPSKSASASVTIVCATPNTISPTSATVGLGQSQSFTAGLCVPSGSAITWDVNGIVGGDTSVGTVSNTGGNTTTYTAPTALPPVNPVTLHATSQSNSAESASATVTVVSNVTVSVAPNSATVLINQRATFTANVSNSSNAAVTWDVNGVVNGNATLGQVCLNGSNPCAPPAGPMAGSVDYLAPATIPSSNPVKLTATSQADPSRQGSAVITLTASTQIGVSVSPPFAFLGSSNTLQFTANVAGTSNQSVNWSVASAVPGQGCGGSACGTVDGNGFYTAPAAAPSPNAIFVTATSQADPSMSASAAVALTSGVVIETILPSSVSAAIPGSFTLAVEGLNFLAGSGSSASVILINGSPRTTACASTTQCLTTLSPSDVGVAGSLSVQVQNPGTPAVLSNTVALVVVPFVVDQDVISLSAASPTAAGKDIVVVEPTTAGATPSQISVNFAGPVTGSGSSANCTFQGSPIPITRPSSGSITVSICVQGNQLDPGFTYEFTGPSTGDIGVVATSLGGLFPNLIQLDLTISSGTLPGVRTLFIVTPNNDRAAASGLIEVK